MLAEQSRALVGTGNPYLPLWEHVPDGEPRVFEDPDNAGKYRVYVIGSHDTRMTSYCGADIRMWSAPVEDLTNWRDEGPLFTYEAQQKWDVMYAPDLVEVNRPDGTRQYYLYPHSRGWQREAMVCRSDRPDGPFTPVNLSADGLRTTEGSMLGFDPSVFIEPVSDPSDPDHATGFRAYGFWGFQRSSAAQLDPNTMCTPRPGTEVIPFFLPACTPDGSVRDPQGTTYPALYSDQKPSDFAFFEASSIRQIGNKYVMIYSGYSGKEYGLPSSNSTLRYAYADTPLGPWRSGGVLVDSRGVVPNEDGSRLITTNAGHNTHGSMQLINGQWYVFYHRPPRGFGFARQSMVAPVSVQSDEKPVSEGGRVVITAYDPYAPNHFWQAAAADGHVYRGAEVTSEGFQLFGMPPYRYYSAGYACYLSQGAVQQDSYDVWDNHMDVDMTGDAIVGFKYFGFGGLQQSQLGLPAFEGTARGNQTQLDIFLEPTTAETFTLSVWMDAPWGNQYWHGRKLGDITIPAGSAGRLSRYTLDVASVVDRLDGKHALYLVASHGASCRLRGLGFSRKGAPLTAPQAPVVTITADGVPVALPAIPEPSTEDNGYTDCTHYRATCRATSQRPVVAATASNPAVRIDIVQQPASATDCAIIKCSFLGKSKTYTLQFVKE
ncbi:MAG: hypothetical protein IJS97_09560 [Prevotella sp.]|nr:hypothetical protein [Prevotella sp.]